MDFLDLNFVANFTENTTSDEFFDAWVGPTDEEGRILLDDADKAIREELKQDADFVSLFMRDCDLGNVEFLELENGLTYIGSFI